MTDDIGVGEPFIERSLEVGGVQTRLRGRQLARENGLAVIADQAQLDGARTCVDDEDAHSASAQLTSPARPAGAGAAPGHAQEATSGRSSPTRRV